MGKTIYLDGQMPLFTPDSDWQPPTELPDLRGKVKEIALDTETNDMSLSAGRGPGWAYGNVKICGVSVAWETGAFYAPVSHPDSQNLDQDAVKRWIDDHAKADIRFVYHNATYDAASLLCTWGCSIPRHIDDTIAMAVMVEENLLSYSLDAVSQWVGIPGKDERLLNEAAASFGYAKNVKSNLWRLPARFVGPYAVQDAVATLEIAQRLRPIIAAEGTGEAYQLEMDLIPMVIEMRRRGIRVDIERAERSRLDLISRRDIALKELQEKLRTELVDRAIFVSMKEINSARHIETWFTKLKIPFNRTEKSQQAQFVIDWMEKHDHWLPKAITFIRQVEMAQSKFLQGFILDYAHKGRIHASINQFKNEEGGTKSHRFSYSDPALQQIYGRGKTALKDELVDIVRGVFLPEKDEIWCSADFSQQEYRLIVHFSEMLKCRKANIAGDRYRNDPSTDFHKFVAEITKLDRSRAKDCNFAKSYGSGVPKFALMTGMGENEAREVMGQYDEELPFVKECNESCKRAAERRGFIRLIDGARCHFNSWEPAYRDWKEESQYSGSESCTPCDFETAQRRIENPNHPWKGRIVRAFTHKAMPLLIQGSAARQTKKAMLLCWQEGIVPLIQMHDELGSSVTSEKQGQRKSEIMREAIKLTVPMRTDCEYGTSWGTARKIETRDKKVLYDASWESAVRLRETGKWW